MRTMLAIAYVFLTMLLAEGTASAQNMIWSGSVDSRGAQSNGPVLAGNRLYVIRVSGSIYFGRWWRNGQPLNDDACYEFTAKGAPDPLPVFRNSYGVSVCDGQYRASHAYQSAAFAGRNAPIAFSIQDTDYRDNSGALRAEIFDVGSAAGPGPGAGDDQYCRDLYARGDAENRAGNAARDRGDLAGANARYQRALALFRQGAADPRCARFRGDFANAAAIVERNIGRVGPGPAGTIAVVSALYGINCPRTDPGRTKDVTQHVARACNGRAQCSYYVNHQTIGDPAVGCRKDFRIQYRCSGGGTKQAFVQPEASGRSALLACP